MWAREYEGEHILSYSRHLTVGHVVLSRNISLNLISFLSKNVSFKFLGCFSNMKFDKHSLLFDRHCVLVILHILHSLAWSLFILALSTLILAEKRTLRCEYTLSKNVQEKMVRAASKSLICFEKMNPKISQTSLKKKPNAKQRSSDIEHRSGTVLFLTKQKSLKNV